MLETLKQQLQGKVSTHPSDLQTHAKDEAYPVVSLPEAVVFAENVQDVQTTLEFARQTSMAVIAFGAGTSLEGHILPQGSALTLDLSRMNRVLQVHPQDFVAIVEPGVTREQLNLALKGSGLFFPVDPGANASLGGMCATNASGTTSVKYGGMHPNVLALQVVLANGEVLELGRGVRKTSAGYDLKDLFIGSEGTLGVITRLTLRLYPIPEHIHTLRVQFSSLEAAAEAAFAVMASGLPAARLELLDELSFKAINAYLGRSYPEQPGLFVEFHSSTAASALAESQLARELMHEAGATDVQQAQSAEERSAQWEARHQLYWALVAQNPQAKNIITDTAVPLSKMPELVRFSQQLLREYDLPGSIAGHVGDGNFHTLIATDESNYPKAEALAARLVERALSLGGTCSGEHGIGLRKKKYLLAEHGPALEWMRQLKQLFDPQNILNPGKVV